MAGRWAFSLALLFGQAGVGAESEAAAVVARSQELADGGDWEQAVAVVRGLLERDSLPAEDRAAGHGQLASLYRHGGDFGRANLEYQQAVSTEPGVPHTLIEWGDFLFEVGDWEGASEKFQTAAEVRPESAAALIGLGRVLLARGNTKAAVERFGQAVSLDPVSGFARQQLGYALFRDNQVQQAVEQLNEAVRLSPELASAHFYLGEALLRAGKTQQALKQYKAAVDLAPSVAEFHLKYGVLLGRNDPAKAVAPLRRALELEADHLAAHHSLGMLLRRLGASDAARHHLKTAQDLAEEGNRRRQAEVETNKAVRLLQSGQLTEAVALFQQVLAATPDFAAALQYRGVALTAIGKHDEAEEAFLAALAKQPDNPEIHYNYGLALKQRADWQAAAREFGAVLDLRPGYPNARCALAEALTQAGEKRKAIDTLTRARELGFCR